MYCIALSRAARNDVLPSLALVWWTWVVYPAQVLGRLRGLPVRNLDRMVAVGTTAAGPSRLDMEG